VSSTEHQIRVTSDGGLLVLRCTCQNAGWSSRAGSQEFIESRPRFRAGGGTAEVIVIWRNWHAARGVAV
jgi:hypothetical protein